MMILEIRGLVRLGFAGSYDSELPPTKQSLLVTSVPSPSARKEKICLIRKRSGTSGNASVRPQGTCCCRKVRMTECDESQGIGSTVPVSIVVLDKKKSTDLELAVNDKTELVSEPTCVQDCGSVSELISDTMEQLCIVDRDDSCGLSADGTNGPRTASSVSPQPKKETISGVSMLGGQKIWQKRGRFIIWPVGLGDDTHM